MHVGSESIKPTVDIFLDIYYFFGHMQVMEGMVVPQSCNILTSCVRYVVRS